MNQWQALDTFWNSFSVLAYDENTVPDDAVYPYITYEANVGQLGDVITLNASLWYKTTRWNDISQKALEISEAIGGGYGVEYDGGRLWVTKGRPFAQRMREETDMSVRRIILMIQAEYQS